MLGVVILQIFPNTKLEPFLYKDKVRLRFGLNTDYYLLNKPAKIYSEFELGLSISLFNTSISVSGVIPISKGFLNKDLKGFFNLNLAYKFDETPLTNYLVHFSKSVSYTHLRAHETVLDLVCRLLLEKKKIKNHLSTYASHTIYILLNVFYILT